MSKLGLFLAFMLLGCSPNFVEENIGKIDSKIVNGSAYSGHPAAVYIDLGGGSCTGTLISPSIVLTAKHCTEGVSAASIEVMFGNNAYGSGTWVQAAHYQNNPKGYSGGPGDLALITLTSPGPTDPIPVNTADPNTLIGIDVHIVGFGVTGEYMSDSGVKRHGWTKLIDAEPGLVYTSVKPSSTCYGDSGGPNFITLDGKEYVLAATSFGTSACGYGMDGAARTDDAMSWINGYISTHEKFAGTCEQDGYCVSGCGAPDLDCPCAGDGFCTLDCADLKLDADCKGCEQDGICRDDCPTQDIDCMPPQPELPVDEGVGGSLSADTAEEPEEKIGPELQREQKPLLWVGCSVTSHPHSHGLLFAFLIGVTLHALRKRVRNVC